VSVEPGREPQAESEPSDQEASTFRNVFGIDWACMRCGADGILQVFSAVAVGGVLYITGFRQPGSITVRYSYCATSAGPSGLCGKPE
jgi:hypothetical protein